MAWLGLYRPTDAQLNQVAEEFGLHEVALEDAIVAHQRPKLERYDETLFVVLRAATYLDEVEEVEFGEIHVFMGPDFVITVRHSETPDLGAVRTRMEANPELLRLGPEAVLYAIVDSVVDPTLRNYAPVTVLGGGQVALSGSSSYRGGTSIVGGTTLLANGGGANGSSTGAGNVFVGWAANSFSGTLTSGQSFITGVSSVSGLVVGQTITGSATHSAA